MVINNPGGITAWLYRPQDYVLDKVRAGGGHTTTINLSSSFKSKVKERDFLFICRGQYPKISIEAIVQVLDFESPFQSTEAQRPATHESAFNVVFLTLFSPPIYEQELFTALRDFKQHPFFVAPNNQEDLFPLTSNNWASLRGLIEKRIDPETYASIFEQDVLYEDVDVAVKSSMKSPHLDQKTALHYDSPLTEDELNRAPIAQGLAVTLDNLYHDTCGASNDSLHIHLHGMWGSGKSTFMRLLSFALQPKQTRKNPHTRQYVDLLPPESNATRDWIVVNFNAWQQQRIAPLWWSLYQTIYTETVNGLNNSGFDRHQDRSAIMQDEKKWRQSVRGPVLPFIVASVMITVIAMWMIFLGDGTLANYQTAIGLVTSLFSIPIMLFNLYKQYAHNTKQGWREEFSNLILRDDDPLNNLRDRFKELVTRVKVPMMIFIDDLDRCDTDHVIELLEVIQTVFNDGRVYFLIAADHRWLHTAYESAYSDMTQSIVEPGKDMGRLFLEKIFQLEVTIPEISSDQKAEYFATLLARQPEGLQHADGAPSPEEITEELGASVESLMARLTDVDVHPQLRQAIGRKAAVQINTRQAQNYLAHFLQPFGTFLGNNPRAMKRYVNAYTMTLTIALVLLPEHFGDLRQRQRLALWMVILTRWPAAVEEIRQVLRNGDLLDFDNTTSLQSIDKRMFEQVWNGVADDVDVELNRDSAKLFLRLTHRT